MVRGEKEREKNKAFQNTHVERSTWLFIKKEGTNKVAVTVCFFLHGSSWSTHFKAPSNQLRSNPVP